MAARAPVRSRVRLYKPSARERRAERQLKQEMFHPSSTSETHSSVSSLQQIPPRSQRFIQLPNAPPIPVYFVQVPERALVGIRGSFASAPPIWPETTVVDRDGQYTWRLVCKNNVVVYIRSRPVPNDPQGVWAISPTREEIFIPGSIAGFNIWYPNPPSPPIPAASTVAGPKDIPTLLTHLRDDTFRGRRCKVCGGFDQHDIYCPSIHPDFTCGWCHLTDGCHELGCSGFVNQ